MPAPRRNVPKPPARRILRRSRLLKPAAAFTGTVIQFAADAITGLVDADPVASWADTSGFANTVVQATGAAQPSYQTAEQNSLPIVRFDGSDRLSKGSAPVGTNTQNFTVFAAVNPTTLAGTNRTIVHVGDQAGGRQWRLLSSGAQSLVKSNVAELATGSTSHAAGTFVVLAVTYAADGTVAFYKTGNVADGGGTTVANFTDATADLHVGSHADGAGQEPLIGDLGELRWFPRVLTAGERAAQFAELEAKWISAGTTAAAGSAAATGSAPNASVAVTANAGAATAIASTGLVETFEAFANGETWADSSTHGQWFVQFGGNTGPGVGIETDGSLVLYEKPTAPTDPDPGDETHSSLVTSTQVFGDIDYRVRAKTVQQLRQNLAPNAWEVAWLVWHYTDNAHFYYVALKSNGVELGKRHPAYAGGQRFLDTPATPTLTIGAWNDFRVTQTGNVITVFIDGVQVSTFTDTGGVQGDAAYTSGQVGLYNEDAWVRFDNVSVNQSVPAVGANAGVGAGSGAALDATVTTTTGGTGPAELASGTGSAPQPTVAVGVNADDAAGIGEASGAIQVAATVDAGLASATGAALDAAVATVTPGTGPAEVAASTGTAPAPAVAVTFSSDVAVGTGTAPDALAAAGALAGPAAGVGAALDVQAVITVNADQAAGTGTAPDPTVSTLALTNANAELATGTGTAPDPTAAVGANAGAVSGTGQAPDATVAIGITVAAELAAGTGSALDPNTAITVPAGVGAGTGLAPDAVGQASRDAPAGLAAATGTAPDASVAIRVAAEVATGTGLAPDPFAYIPPPVPPPRWLEGDTTGTGLTEGATSGNNQVEGVLVGVGIVEGSSSV